MAARLLLATVLAASSGFAQAPSGRWDGNITIAGLKVPFTIVFENGGAGLAGPFVNGDRRVTSTSGSFEGGVVQLHFGPGGAVLRAKLENEELKGEFGGEKLGMHRITAAPYCTCFYEGEAGPEIMGEWEAPETGWKLSIRRTGEDTLAVVSRPEGSLGPLAGRFDGLSFTLRYFDGTRAAVLEMEPRKDGGLDLVWREPGQAARKLKAVKRSGA